MGLDEIKKVLGEYKSALKDRYHVNTIGIFGSYVRNEQAGDSIFLLILRLP
jgi:predicted nucleotidyltransferase